MLVTEEQAKEMWCPAARVAFVEKRLFRWISYIGYNRICNASRIGTGTATKPSPSAHCIARKCMWWRWEMGAGEQIRGDVELVGGAGVHRGYCGIAGKP